MDDDDQTTQDEVDTVETSTFDEGDEQSLEGPYRPSRRR